MKFCLSFSKLGSVSLRRSSTLSKASPNDISGHRGLVPKYSGYSQTEQLKVRYVLASPENGRRYRHGPPTPETVANGYGPQINTTPRPNDSKYQSAHLGNRDRKRRRTSPPVALARWLDLCESSAKAEYWNSIKKTISPSSLPTILLHFLHRSGNPDANLDDGDQGLVQAATTSLENRGLTFDDVTTWAWIISGRGADDMVERFISIPSEKPTFLLLEILRQQIVKAKNLKLILNYAWDQILGKSRPDLSLASDAEVDAIIPRLDERLFSLCASRSSLRSSPMEETSFTVLISRLLAQARRIWAPATVSISHMVAPYIQSILKRYSKDPKRLDPRTHNRLCKLHNQVLRLLSLPASIEPLKSTAHSWRAQRVLLEMAGNFEPPLTLDQNSYRAVVQVLAASKKSDRESLAATLRTRSWPPWRVDKDGMDAQRSPEDDTSRVISAAMRTKESGYNENAEDEAMNVLGGQESDGTPTIHTRKLIKRRAKNSSEMLFHTDISTKHWAARIEATRDVEEAWGAFAGFRDRGGKPSLSMYLTMFEKLNSESARSGREAKHDVLPGDGKEVFPASDDNFSTFYKSRRRPPTINYIYEQMIHAGLRPSGRCLNFLIRHAKSTDRGLRYLRDGRIDSRAVAYLEGSHNGISPTILEKVPTRTFEAFICLLCRFAPRAILSAPADASARSSTLQVTSDGHVAADAVTPAEKVELLETRWRILERQSRGSSHPHRLNPLLHAVELLNQSQTRFKPAWYALFRTLARRGVIIDKNMVGDPMNDIKSWRVLLAALSDFHKRGLELDPLGFQILCKGFEKAILASPHVSEEDRESVFEASQLVKNEFIKLCESGEAPYHVPTLLHSIGGAQLHAYIRALGLVDDHLEILSVLEWMVRYREELNSSALQSRNGPRLIRRAIIAIRAFCSQTAHESEARRLVESVETWDGWPTAYEVQDYIDRGSAGSAVDNVSP